MSRGSTIPTGIDDITAAWVTTALGAGVGPDASVVDVRARPVGVGLGLLGSLHRLDLTWRGGGGPGTVVAKLPAAGMRSRSVATAMAMYPREVRFYRDLADGTGIAVGCLHAAVDERTHDFVLLLADLSGATMIDQIAGCPLERATELVVALAAFHARHWDERGLDGAPWLTRFADSALAGELAAAVRACWPVVRERFGAELGTAAVDVGDRLGDLLPSVAAALSEPPVTLVHGDLRLDNVFFVDGGVRLCDWQLTGRSRGARDLAYFMTQSLTAEVRAAHETALVECYLTELAANGVAAPPADRTWSDYRQGVLLGFAYAIVAAGGLDQEDPRSAALPGTLLRRSAQAMEDQKVVLPER